jgi:uncharacterized membrane protein (DUF4010 family)
MIKNKVHATQLLSHFKQKHTWLDIIGLVLVWSLALKVPAEVNIILTIPFATILKISALVATLELMAFFLFHLFSRKNSLLIQCFLGGFISSTLVFLKIVSENNSHIKINRVTQIALLLTMLAMTIESLTIIMLLHPHDFWPIAVPFLTQLLLLLLLLIIFHVVKIKSLKNSLAPSTISLPEYDHPILWKNVAKFSLIMLVLIYVMRFLNQFLTFPAFISSMIVAMFEAHGALVAADSLPSYHHSILAILIGSNLSKILILLKLKDPQLKKFLIFSIFGITTFCLVVFILIDQLF